MYYDYEEGFYYHSSNAHEIHDIIILKATCTLLHFTGLFIFLV